MASLEKSRRDSVVVVEVAASHTDSERVLLGAPDRRISKTSTPVHRRLLQRSWTVVGVPLLIVLTVLSLGWNGWITLQYFAMQDEVTLVRMELAEVKGMFSQLRELKRSQHKSDTGGPRVLDQASRSIDDSLQDGTDNQGARDEIQPFQDVADELEKDRRDKRDTRFSEGRQGDVDAFIAEISSRSTRNTSEEGAEGENHHRHGHEVRGRHHKKCVDGMHLIPEVSWEDAYEVIKGGRGNAPHSIANVQQIFNTSAAAENLTVEGKYGHMVDGDLFSPGSKNDGRYHYWREDPSYYKDNMTKSCMKWNLTRGTLTITEPGYYLIYSQMTNKMFIKQDRLQLIYNHKVYVNDKAFISCFSTLSMYNSSSQRPAASCHTSGTRWLEAGDNLHIKGGYTLPARHVKFDSSLTFWGLQRLY